jgi:hypothetical protein
VPAVQHSDVLSFELTRCLKMMMFLSNSHESQDDDSMPMCLSNSHDDAHVSHREDVMCV